MYVPTSELASKIDELKNGRTWANICEEFGLDDNLAPTLAQIRNRRPGACTAQRENDIRKALGMSYVNMRDVEIPNGHSARVFIMQDGNDAFEVHHAPIGTKVVIIPNGAKVSRPKPTPPEWVTQAADWLAAKEIET